MKKFVAVAAIVLLGTSGCAWSSYWDYRESRKRLEECEETHGRGAAECDRVRDRAQEDFDRYERDSQSGWGCTASGPGADCPPER
jgi:hypothetical protein